MMWNCYKCNKELSSSGICKDWRCNPNLGVELKGNKMEQMTLNYWRDVAHENSKAHGFYDGGDCENIYLKLDLIHAELSEALEELRKGKGRNEIYFEDGKEKPEGFPVEIADVFIRLFDLCGWLGIDVDYVVKLKHEYNKSRPYKHNKKF